MRKSKIFDPYKVRPEDYRSHYPELKRIPEFETLSATELIFVWYYANPTSDIIDIKNDMERVVKALHLSNFTPSKASKDDILVLKFPEKFAVAIERMSRFEPDARMQGRIMIETILKNYTNLCNIDDYKDEDNNVDRKKYVDTTKIIAVELPSLISKLEEGFGVTTRGEDEIEQGMGFSRDFYTTLNK